MQRNMVSAGKWFPCFLFLAVCLSMPRYQGRTVGAVISVSALPVWKAENGWPRLEASLHSCACRHMSELTFLPCLRAHPSPLSWRLRSWAAWRALGREELKVWR